MELILTHTGRLNFTQLARCGRSCESRFRQNFKKSFDWLSFNRSFLESTKGHRIAMSGKTPNMRLNNTDFKELLFYSVRAAV